MATTTLTGTTGNDILNAPGSVTTLVAGFQGNDTITLALQGDQSNAGAGNDSITVAGSLGVKSNTINAGSGDDTLFLASGSVSNFQGQVFLEDGNDLFLNSGNVQLVGASVGGNAGNDTIVLNGGILNSLVGGGKDTDSIAVTAGTVTNATIIGGGGRDTINFAAAAATLTTIQAADGHDIIQLTALTGSNSLVVAAGKGFDSIALGNTQVASIAGGALNDTISFNGAFAGGTIFGDGFGVVTGSTNSGADLISTTAVLTAATTIAGGGLNDTISFGAISGAGAAISINGGNGADLIGNSGMSLSAATGGVTIDGGAGFDVIKLGGMGAATGLVNRFLGGDGGDSIYMRGSGLASINGGSGNDTINFISSASLTNTILNTATVNGGSGVDSLIFGDGNLSGLLLTAVAATAQATVAANNLVATYGSGDVLQITTTAISSANIVGTNWGSTNAAIYYDNMTAISGLTAASIYTTLTGGVSSAGSIAVFDSNGLGTAGGDLIIGIWAGDATSLTSFVTVVGGDQLITTTTAGLAGTSSFNATLAFNGGGSFTITLG